MNIRKTFHSIRETIKWTFHLHSWMGIGPVIRLHEPTEYIYYTERTTWRQCTDPECKHTEVFWIDRYWSRDDLIKYKLSSRGTYCNTQTSAEKRQWFEQMYKWVDAFFNIPKDALLYESYIGHTKMEAFPYDYGRD